MRALDTARKVAALRNALEPPQIEILARMAVAGATISEVARETGMHRTTVRHRLLNALDAAAHFFFL